MPIPFQEAFKDQEAGVGDVAAADWAAPGDHGPQEAAGRQEEPPRVRAEGGLRGQGGPAAHDGQRGGG